MGNIIIQASIGFPILIGIILLIFRGSMTRKVIVTISSLLLIASSIFVYTNTPFKSTLDNIGGISLKEIITIADFILMGFLLYMSIKYKKIFAATLILLQAIPLAYFEFIVKPEHIVNDINHSVGKAIAPALPITFINDHLSMVMMFLILVIGSLIAIFALKYMDEYEHHQHLEKTKQPLFFFIVFLFLGAMSGIVLSNNLLYTYFFWEVTTLCSFLLISFSKTDEAINNAFRALWMNLLGGVAFIFAIILFQKQIGTFMISDILSYKDMYFNAGGEITPYRPFMLPLALIAIAAFTKAAQFPFQSWLLGAMVAPTPVSALLHSSTMVKAGVFLLLRFSPLLKDTKLGYVIAIIGGFSFFIASALAIGQSNAKRVLAYSTIANLGLIVATAGIATPLAITASVLLIIFHAVSKALLFLCVGTIEHGINSRDIEDMDGLISKMPLVGALTAIGMFSMLLPPFGVIITKLMGIEAAVNAPVVLLFLVMGSSLTVIFWGKWMGKILTTSNEKEQRLEQYSLFTVLPLSLLAIGVILVSVGLPQVYKYFVFPYTKSIWLYNMPIGMGSAILIPIFIAILCLLLLIPIFKIKFKSHRISKPYLCGENTIDGQSFTSTADTESGVKVGNYYLEQFFNEKELTIVSNILAVAFIIYMVGVVI